MTCVELRVPTVPMADVDSCAGEGVLHTKPHAPVITEAVTLYNSGENATVTQMTPQQEYAVKVTVADTSTIDDLNTVTVTIFYDSDGDDASGDIPAADAQVCFVMTCTVGSTPGVEPEPQLEHNLGHSGGQLHAAESHCRQRELLVPLQAGQGGHGGRGLGRLREAVDDGVMIRTPGMTAVTMTCCGMVRSTCPALPPTGAPSCLAWTSASASAKESVTVTYISNGNYDAAISTSDWTGSGNTATLNTAGTPGANEFSMKAWSSDNLTAADLVTTVGRRLRHRQHGVI